MNENKIISLDPSSTIVGYAVISRVGRLIEAGCITPPSRKAPSYERICSMRRDLRELLDTTQPQTILLEWTKGKVGKRHQGLGAGLAVYGCGVGAIATECEHWAESRPAGMQVIPVVENDWTRSVPKRDRQLAIATEYSDYRISDDPGGDAADAIGLARWWLKERAFLWS